MKRIARPALVAALSLSLAGCNYASFMNGVNADVTATNTTLANLAANDMPTACGIVAVAEGYFHQLDNRVSAANIAIEARAEASVKVLCDNPPSNIAQVGAAIAKLANLWIAIQNATKTS